MFIGQPELGETLMRGLELKGDLPQALDPRVQPGVNLLDFDQFEYWFLRRKIAFAQTRSQAALAANFGQLFFMPPGATAGKRSMSQVRRLTFVNSSAGALQYNFGLSNLGILGGAGPQFGFEQDDRFGLAISGCQLLAGTNAAAQMTTASMGIRALTVPASSSVTVDVDYMLTGKNFSPTALFCLMAETTVVNVPIQWTVEWTERLPLDSEL